MTNETKGRAIVGFEKIILNIEEVAYAAGEKEGRKNGVSEYKKELDREFEKYGTNYAILQFQDCKTISDFQDKLKEITNRSFNFM